MSENNNEPIPNFYTCQDLSSKIHLSQFKKNSIAKLMVLQLMTSLRTEDRAVVDDDGGRKEQVGVGLCLATLKNAP
jgi:hypothetical protein